MLSQRLTYLAVALPLALLPACESTHAGAGGGTATLTGPLIRAEVTWGQHTWLHFGQPPLDCWTVTLIGHDGAQQEISGNGPTELQIPPSTTRAGVLQYPCPTAAPPPGALSSGHVDGRLHDTSIALHGMPLTAPGWGEVSEIYSLTASHPDVEEAEALLTMTASAGAGAVVPAVVTVHAMARAWPTLDGLVIETSLPERFESFVVFVDDEVIADADSAFNVVANTTSNGWVTLTTVIPSDLLVDAATITMQQAGRIAAAPFEGSIEL